MIKEYNEKLSKLLVLRIVNNTFLIWSSNLFPQARGFYYFLGFLNTIITIWDVKEVSSVIEEYRNALIDGYGSIEEEYKHYKYEDFLKDKKMFTPIEINKVLQSELKKTVK